MFTWIMQYPYWSVGILLAIIVVSLAVYGFIDARRESRFLNKIMGPHKTS